MLTAIIIDDETSSRNTLRQKLKNNCPGVAVIAECENAEQGIKSIEENRPDMIFLDIEMPRMNGFTMLKQLKQHDFEIIFITAYDHFAIQAIKYSALDYLVKPVEIEDLKTAVNKAIQKRKQSAGNERLELLLQNLMNEKKEHYRIAIPSMEGLLFVETDDIIYLEALSNYTNFYLANNKKICNGFRYFSQVEANNFFAFFLLDSINDSFENFAVSGKSYYTAFFSGI